MTRNIIYRHKKGEWIPVGIAIEMKETQSGVVRTMKPEGLKEEDG